MSISVRSVQAEEIETFQRTMAVPFSFDATPERLARFSDVFEPDRLCAAFDGEQMVATLGALSLSMTVPGGSLATAGTTVVTVLPTHRRQGLLRALMTRHLAEARERGEVLAALWASESTIYRRFGYGPAVDRLTVRIDKAAARMRDSVEIVGTMRLVDLQTAQETFPPIYDRVEKHRPGMFARSAKWWRHRVLGDYPDSRFGSTELRRVLHVRNGQPAGYCLYRTRSDWEPGSQGSLELRIAELFGVDAAAEKALWRFVFGVDLVTSIAQVNQPLDSPLRWWLDEPRRLERKIHDSLWLRLLDAKAALEARRYSSAGSLVFRLHDEQCPANSGVQRLEVDDDGCARCRPAKVEPEVSLSADVLGMAYLGGHRFGDLARAGLLKGTEDALRRADTLFAWSPLPWCQELF